MYLPANIRAFASTRETSDEIALAIFELASEGDEPRMWQDPTEAEIRAVAIRAWELCRDTKNTLYWGCETFHRALILYTPTNIFSGR